MEPTREAVYRRGIAEPEDEVEAWKDRATQAEAEVVMLKGQGGREAQNPAQRFRLHGEAYFRFIITPGVEPTHNLAEQAMRFVVIDRRITQGTRSVRGRQWCERIWTVIATCTPQARSVFDDLREAILAHFQGQPIPSLLPAGP